MWEWEPGAASPCRAGEMSVPITGFRRPATCSRSSAGNVVVGRTRTGATSLRKRVLCPLSYEPLEASVGFEPT
jgi:hypothetical protein